MDNRFCLITKYGAIELTRFVTTIGRLRCAIKLHSAECDDIHGSFIILPDGKIKLRNRSTSCVIFINDDCINPGEKTFLNIGDIISFSGVESFRLLSMDELEPIEVTDIVPLSPD